MISNDRFDRELVAALGDLAPLRSPDYLSDILGRTARTRQRPAWASLERLLPMDIATKVAGAMTFPWRRLALIAVLGLLLAVATAIYSGSQREFPAAPPFGLAGNGLVAYETNGDIFVSDPVTGAVSPITSGADAERQPIWSPNGTRLAYTASSSDGVRVVVVRPDGSGKTIVTPEPLRSVDRVVFSPDGSQLVIAAGRDVSTALALASVAGDRFEWLETNGPAIFPVFRPPDGAELLFAGGSVDAGGMALYALDLASRQITQIAAPRKGGQFTGSPQYSPDGTRIAYTYWISGTPDVGVVLYEERESRVHIVDAEGATEPVRIPVPDGLCCDGFPAWSNDGTRLAFVRWYDVPADKGIAIVPVEIGGAGRWYPVPSLDTVRLTWSPDDRFLLVTPLDSSDIRLPQVRLDVETGAIVDIPWETTSDPAWQRLAP